MSPFVINFLEENRGSESLALPAWSRGTGYVCKNVEQRNVGIVY